MTTHTTDGEGTALSLRVLVGYDGSASAADAITAGAALFPTAAPTLAYLWLPPFASPELTARLRRRARNLNDLVESIEREGSAEAQRVVDAGLALARSAGWEAEGLIQRTYGGEGFQMSQLAEELDSDLVLVGSRGLGGTSAVLGSVADVIVHYSATPVLVVPPLAAAERETLMAGPIVVGWDGSAGAQAALDAAATLFPRRELIAAEVRREGEQSLWTGAEGGPVATAVRLRLDSGVGVGVGRAIAQQLDACATERGAAAIVVGSRGRSVVRELLLGSVAKATLHNVRRPVVVVPSGR